MLGPIITLGAFPQKTFCFAPCRLPRNGGPITNRLARLGFLIVTRGCSVSRRRDSFRKQTREVLSSIGASLKSGTDCKLPEIAMLNTASKSDIWIQQFMSNAIEMSPVRRPWNIPATQPPKSNVPERDHGMARRDYGGAIA